MPLVRDYDAAPPAFAEAITPDDNAIRNIITRGVYLGAAGDLTVELESGSVVTFKEMAAGVIHPLKVKRVYATGTTATDIIGVW